MFSLSIFVLQGQKLKCRSNCEDQTNVVLATSSAYPNKGVFVKRYAYSLYFNQHYKIRTCLHYRPEFCYTVLRLLSKCATTKRRPLSQSIPGLCEELDLWRTPLSRCSSPSDDGKGAHWDDIKEDVSNCSSSQTAGSHCLVEEMVWKYARKNLAMLNIFIKVRTLGDVYL